jgi:hypothetical protein
VHRLSRRNTENAVSLAGARLDAERPVKNDRAHGRLPGLLPVFGAPHVRDAHGGVAGRTLIDVFVDERARPCRDRGPEWAARITDARGVVVSQDPPAERDGLIQIIVRLQWDRRGCDMSRRNAATCPPKRDAAPR